MQLATPLVDRPARAAAVVVGAMIAAGTTSAVALSSAAVAHEPGRCTENVNVRAEPDTSSEIVTLCRAGTRVTIGETRNGFVQLVELDGWAAQEFVSDDAGSDDSTGGGDGGSAGGGGADARNDDPEDGDGATGSSDSSEGGGSSSDSSSSGGSGGGSPGR